MSGIGTDSATATAALATMERERDEALRERDAIRDELLRFARSQGVDVDA